MPTRIDNADEVMLVTAGLIALGLHVNRSTLRVIQAIESMSRN